jgi:hypothetical protein
MKMEQCSETSAYTIQTPGNYPEESTQQSEHGESLTPRIFIVNFQQAACVQFVSSDALGWCFSLFNYADRSYILVGRCLGLVFSPKDGRR